MDKLIQCIFSLTDHFLIRTFGFKCAHLEIPVCAAASVKTCDRWGVEKRIKKGMAGEPRRKHGPGRMKNWKKR